MSRHFKLNNTPLLTINFFEDKFEIKDNFNIKNSGIYEFDEIKEIQFNEAKTNWYISLLSIIIDLITGSANGGKFRNKPFILIKLTNRELKLKLIDSGIEEAEKKFKAIKNLTNN